MLDDLDTVHVGEGLYVEGIIQAWEHNWGLHRICHFGVGQWGCTRQIHNNNHHVAHGGTTLAYFERGEWHNCFSWRKSSL